MAEVQAALRRHLRGWTGRAILVRGWQAGYAAAGCPRPATGHPITCRRYTQIYLAAVPATGEWPTTELAIALPPGTRLAEVDRLETESPPQALAIAVHNLLPGLYPWGGAQTLRIRLWSPRPCMVRNDPGPNCSAGLLLSL